jgi:SAM-dependent methyltransferase
MIEPLRFCSIDEAGVVYDDQKQRISDPDVIEEFFSELKVNDNYLLSAKLHDVEVIVESYDAPLVAKQISLEPTGATLKNIYGITWPFNLDSIVTDEWDRFYGLTTSGLEFVMSNEAQNQFFDQLDEFSDESITYLGQCYPVQSYWPNEVIVEDANYWTEKYLANESGWNLGEPAVALKSLLPKLKLPASRIIVIGGGEGHDAALFAQQGHHVTLVDISCEAINRAKKNYGHLTNLNFLEADLFDLPVDMYGQFDLVFEHTCYCAVNPSLRPELVRQWRRLLDETGFLLGVFFAMPKRSGPPFGGSEWELRKRLENGFQAIVWQRFRQSIRPRLGRELLIYARKATL